MKTENFALVHAQAFRRTENNPLEVNATDGIIAERPHIIGLTPRARSWIRASRRSGVAGAQLAKIFGPLYTGGCGLACVSSAGLLSAEDKYKSVQGYQWEPSLRFQMGNNPETLHEILSQVEVALTEHGHQTCMSTSPLVIRMV